MAFTNASAIPLSLATWLATDNYDHEENTISATTIIKPIRQIILGSRINTEDVAVDIANLVSSRMGSAIHDAIERAWVNNHKDALSSLGFPEKILNRIKVNPNTEEVTEGCIPIYLEQRAYKKVGNYTISGKFDFVGEGRVEDFKSTSTYTYMNQTNAEKYILQGSIYRWLNPEIITRDEMAIQYIFTDWNKAKALADPKYPQQRTVQQLYPLKSVEATDVYIKNKIKQIDLYKDSPEDQLPFCTDADLWRSDPVWKYYKNPSKMTRSTKNFDNKQEAYIRLAEEGGTGIVVEQPGQVTACRYCNAFGLCTQKDQLIASGQLTL